MSVARPSTPSFAPVRAASTADEPAPGRAPAVVASSLMQSSDGSRTAPPWPALVGAVLGLGAASIVALGLVGQWLERVRGVRHSFGFIFQFAPDEEGNLATWYSSALLLACAALLGAIAWRTTAGQRYRRHWAGLAILLALMSADETAQMHEMLIAPLRAIWDVGGVFHFAWVIPGMAFVLCVLLACAGFLRSLPPRTRALFAAAAAVYLGGALGIEMVDGYYASRWGSATLAYGMLTSLEEALELAGAVLLAYALADYLKRYTAPVHAAPPVQ